jgi:hypothetical protein
VLQPVFTNLPSIRQNAFYSVQMRLTDALRPVKIENSGILRGDCHGFGINDKVVLLSKEPSATLCGAAFNELYFVSSSDFSLDTFRLTPVIGQASLNISGGGDQEFWVAQPFDITGYTIDSDICTTDTNARVQVATFTPTIDDATNGLFTLELAETVTVKMKAGTYAFDVSLTPSGGNRFYAIEGEIPVVITRSR